MPAKKGFPGQSSKTVFSLEQAKSLSSAIRTEVFWSFNQDEPLSVSEVASALGKSAQTVHYHTNELVKVGLLMPAGSRRRRARTETLYVHASRNFIGQGPAAPPEYRQYVIKAFSAIARAMVREETALHRVYDLGDASISHFSAYKRETLRLAPRDADELRRRLYAVVDDMRQFETTGDDSVRVNVAIFMKPTQGESKHWAARIRAGKEQSRKRPLAAARIE